MRKGKTTHESENKIAGDYINISCFNYGIGGSSVFMISSTVKKNEELKDKMEFQKEIKHIQYELTGLMT